MKSSYAIDLGSSNTVIYKSGQGILLKEPSLVAIVSDGKKKLLKSVGMDAKKLIGKTNSTVEIIEPITEGVIINKQLTTFAYFL